MIKTNHLKLTCLFYHYCHYIKLSLETLNLFYSSQLTLLISVLFPTQLSSVLQLFWFWSFLNIMKSTFWRSFCTVLSVLVTHIIAVLSQTTLILSRGFWTKLCNQKAASSRFGVDPEELKMVLRVFTQVHTCHSYRDWPKATRKRHSRKKPVFTPTFCFQCPKWTWKTLKMHPAPSEQHWY